jgi:hypothetical protein
MSIDMGKTRVFEDASNNVVFGALLDSNKEPLVVGKPSYPVKRIGAQVFAIKLDF